MKGSSCKVVTDYKNDDNLLLKKRLSTQKKNPSSTSGAHGEGFSVKLPFKTLYLGTISTC